MENGHFLSTLLFCFIGNRVRARQRLFSRRKSFELKIHVEDNINTKCKQSSGYITQIIKNEIFNST